MAEMVGREEELAAIEALIARADGERTALVLEGEAGIGKSTVWLAGVEQARTRGLPVLSARPTEAERGLPYVGLGDLLDGQLGSVVDGLARPRRRALELALLLDGDGSDEAVDPRALGLALRDALERVAGDGHVVVAIDDVQWLDASSADALAFALRRLVDSRVLLLLARRTPAPATPVEDAVLPERRQQVALGPLSVGALHRVLRDRLGRPYGRRTLLGIHERSAGNPFFALQLAGLVEADADPSLPLVLPDSLEEVVASTLAGLPASTRAALALAAAAGSPSEALLRRAAVRPAALEPAFTARVVERDGRTIRFTHPLLASVLYATLGARERRAVHGRLAEAVDDPVERARHLALATSRPDAGVSTALDEAARQAASRGASAAAAELAEQALRLTPTAATDDRDRRALAAARAEQGAGEWMRAQTIAGDVLARSASNVVRAEALVLLAELESVDSAVSLLEQALVEAASQPALQVQILLKLAWATRYRLGCVGAAEHARAALEIAEQLDDDAERAAVHFGLAWLGELSGDAEAPVHAARALAIAQRLGSDELAHEASVLVARSHVARLEVDVAREVLERELRRWTQRSEIRSAWVEWELAWVELYAGRWTIAAALAAHAREVQQQYEPEIPQHTLPMAMIAVHRGALAAARELSERALELAQQKLGLRPPIHLAVVGLAALWGGDAAAGEAWLEQADRQAVALEWGDPYVRSWTPDHVEALLEAGRIEDARRLLERWEADAARLHREWLLARATRSRGLIAAATGDVQRAASLLEQAVEEHERLGDAFDRARALLALGVVRRRARRKRPAQEAIGAALEGFEELGAASWASRARSELGRIGGRRREEGLTAAERRVAVLVAQGRTNREVAAALFLGERTVASHLTSVYQKLGVRSRTELARRLG
jgi:DNA-binding CsgD family transcriptional regulator